MTKKIFKIMSYLFGAFLAFLFKYGKTPAFADVSVYGIAYTAPIHLEEVEQITAGEKILSIVLTPLFVFMVFFLATVVGIIFYLRYKRKHDKKNSKSNKEIS